MDIGHLTILREEGVWRGAAIIGRNGAAI